MSAPVMRAAAACAAVVAMACACAGQAGPGTPPHRDPSASPSATASSRPAGPAPGLGVLGRFRTGKRRVTFTEPARSGPRRLITVIRYPLGPGRRPARGPLPMIVFGPGFQQCDTPYAALLRAWASAGYVVAAVNFPYSDCLASSPTESDMVNQPADMSYVITKMLALSAAGRGPAGLMLARHQIAIAGQSDGGDTVAAVAANSCCTDRRVRATAVLSGAQWPAMPGAFFTRRPAPMLFVQGSADTVNLPGCSVAMYRADPSRERYYLDLFGADHLSPYWGTGRFERVTARVTLAFFNRFVLGQAAAGPAMRRHGDVPGISALYSHGRGHLVPGPCVT